jgi:hypothetical protein
MIVVDTTNAVAKRQRQLKQKNKVMCRQHRPEGEALHSMKRRQRHRKGKTTVEVTMKMQETIMPACPPLIVRVRA